VALETAVAAVGVDPTTRPLEFTRPPEASLGHYATNAAMLIAGGFEASPRELAARIAEDLKRSLGPAVASTEVAGPGFVNVSLSGEWHRQATAQILDAGTDFGRTRSPTPQRVLVEFVSANPTGPLTAASGRGAAYGESLARLLEATGHEVGREYFLNDAGGQVDRFAASLAAAIRGELPPEDGYSGEYVAGLAALLQREGVDPADLAALGVRGTAVMQERIEATLKRFGVRFDTWFSERSLHEAGAVEATVEELRARGHVFDDGGAVWLRTTGFADTKDRVLVRADGEPTYFAADIAYHRDKLGRGWEHLIVPLGSDHHGYVPRMKAALDALSGAGEAYEAPMMQLVQIVEGGRRARMSKRKGQFVTLDDLMDDIGVDATRYFMLQRSHDTALDLDLDLAREASQENPVYYVQYAHARIASILRKAVDGGAPVEESGQLNESAVARALTADGVAAELHPSEGALIRRLLEFPSELVLAAERRAPHRLCAYATATAADFHAFYRDCQVVGGEPGLEAARLGTCLAARRVLAATLDLIGVSAPDTM
jgi:arginyl-tRNA synthetase